MSEILDSKVDKLEAMFGHFGHLSPDELRDKVRKVRADRRVGKVKAAAKKKAKTSSDGAKSKVKSMLDKLGNPKLMEMLLKELGDGSND